MVASCLSMARRFEAQPVQAGAWGVPTSPRAALWREGRSEPVNATAATVLVTDSNCSRHLPRWLRAVNCGPRLVRAAACNPCSPEVVSLFIPILQMKNTGGSEEDLSEGAQLTREQAEPCRSPGGLSTGCAGPTQPLECRSVRRGREL